MNYKACSKKKIIFFQYVNYFFTEKLLMEAFRTDCQALITRFELTYNTHFQNFCEIWKDMQFSLVFRYVHYNNFRNFIIL